MPCYSSVYLSLLLVLICSPVVLADDWEDFTNNLATDLAPLITLFGERLTKQFLSESINLLDNFIFALAPLGVLTAVVSVIRVRGSPSLKAFVGRAQEGPAEAESELLPCVSESTGELFNEGGISRVFGRPKILELVTWENKEAGPDEESIEIGTLFNAVRHDGWSAKRPTLSEPDSWDDRIKPDLAIPNLSLNKGIKRRGHLWFHCAAILGVLLQVGVVIYAAITVFIFPQSFQVNGKAVDSYAFPFYVVGTVFLFIGMFYCAVLIERSSEQYYFEPKNSSKIYWLQPGNQYVGDQVFNAFIAESTMTTNMKYIKSTRVQTHDGGQVEIYTTLLITMLGFILQFIGERGLHASVILAQLGATFVMSVLRTCLRTERMTPDENMLSKDEQELVTLEKQELDAFTFHLKNVESFTLVSVASPDISTQDLDFAAHPTVNQLIKTRRQLAGLTNGAPDGSSAPWGDTPTRKAAQSLAQAMMATMVVLSSWGHHSKGFKPHLTFEYKSTSPKATEAIVGTYCVDLLKRYNSVGWQVDPNELEAMIGLWTWSLYRDDKRWRGPLTRMVGLSKSQAMSEETFRYFHKWMYRITPLQPCSASQVDVSQRLFGLGSDKWGSDTGDPADPRILMVSTNNRLEKMVAQDIYIHFLSEALADVRDLGGDIDMVPDLHNSWLVQSSRIGALVQCFEESNLGSMEDALLCIVPVLKHLGILPELGAHSSSVRQRTEQFVKSRQWDTAFSLVRWFCVRTSGSEFEQSMYELGSLCRRALVDNNTLVRESGFDQICDILKSDIQLGLYVDKQQARGPAWSKTQGELDWWHSFTTQLGWVLWRLSTNTPTGDKLQSVLESVQAPRDFPAVESDQHVTETTRGMRALEQWLTHADNDLEFERDFPGDDDALGFEWALKTGRYAILYFFLAKWAELSSDAPTLAHHAYLYAARSHCQWAIEVLRRHGADIEAKANNGSSVLMALVLAQDLEGILLIIQNGVDIDGRCGGQLTRPLDIAAHEGYDNVVETLLQHGARVESLTRNTMSALYWACSNNKPSTVRLLLSYGAEMDPIGPRGATPLLTAVMDGHTEIVEILVQAGAKLNARDDSGRTAVMLAARFAPIEILNLLISSGALTELRDINGMTALDLVTEFPRPEAAAILQAAATQPSI
ncbi:uncharacterized protein N7459_000349 [Penicillium hispanicum]|uniref:uncharacterized protein n=1 Tax=Penicillium hispanicum TaxID=1080232 RepID=UPI002542151B|nr:uncharacterized protein N7459_000349 [Penicillium hispanicum]KAJ5594141.1 hypothetical protein N7459_000349 [Penicillium hispanicum]